MDLTLDSWSRMTPDERAATARRIASDLPSGFMLGGLQTFTLGDQQHEIALYHFQGATFALIPGGSVQLGYDAGRFWEPNRDELESWRYTVKEHGFERTLDEHIAEVTLRPRTLEIGPLLVETLANEVGWESVPIDDPSVQAILKEYGGQSSSVEVVRGESQIRVQRDTNGSVMAQRSVSLTHAQLLEKLRPAGFRLPTSDEWEYACGCGTDTLFRWGDHVPCDRYPTDVSPEEAAWRRKWVLSMGKLEYPKEGFASDWDWHRKPNAFGLFIASNPYRFELVQEPAITRGGDGGVMICGGAGFFIGWLTLATAYFEPDTCERPPAEPINPGYIVARRVLPLEN